MTGVMYGVLIAAVKSVILYLQRLPERLLEARKGNFFVKKFLRNPIPYGLQALASPRGCCNGWLREKPTGVRTGLNLTGKTRYIHGI